MKITHLSAWPMRARLKSGFSLVEVALALGVISFGLISLLGLIPTGLKVLVKAKDLALESTISQTVVTQARQTSFSNLPGFAAGSPLYFDEQGNSATTLSASKYVYKAVVAVTYNSGFPVDQTPATASATTASAASVLVTITKISHPGNPYLFSTFIANNGL